MKLCVFARDDCLMQIKAAGDVYELGDTALQAVRVPADGDHFLAENNVLVRHL